MLEYCVDDCYIKYMKGLFIKSMTEQDAMNEIKQMDIKQMLSFVFDMLAAYPTEKLLEFKAEILASGELESKEEMLLVIEEILRLREEGQ